MAFQGFKAAGKEETPSFTQAAYAEAKMANDREMQKQAYKAQMLQAGGIGATTYNQAMGDDTPIADYLGEQFSGQAPDPMAGDAAQVYSDSANMASSDAGMAEYPAIDPTMEAVPLDTTAPEMAPEMALPVEDIPPAGGLPADAITPDMMQDTGASMVDPMADATLRQSLEQAAAEQAAGDVAAQTAGDVAIQEAGTQVAAEGAGQLAGAQAASSWNPYLSAALLAYRMYA